jgi:twinkle protein
MTMSAAAMEWLESRGLDVELADRLGISSENRAGGGEALALPFRREGEVVRRKFRFLRPQADRPAWIAEKGGQRIAFNEDCLRDDKLINQPVIITEGEWDCMAALQAGFGRTISVPDGAPPPGERDKAELEGSAKYAWLEGIWPYLTKERVSEGFILATDGDENGAALMQDLSVLLGRARCKFVTYPKARRDRGRQRCKDLNEVLEDYGAKGIVETMGRATWLKVDGVYRMSELPPLGPQVIYELPDIRFHEFRQNFKVRLGDFIVVTGTPGFGKTTAVNDLLCSLAQEYGIKIGWASFEQEPQRDHRRALRSWLFERPDHTLDESERRTADGWIDDHHVFVVPGENDDATLNWLIEKMEVAVVRHGVKVFVIDPWNELEHDRRREETETEYIGRAIRTLKRFAKAFRIAVVVIAHPTKSAKDADGNYRMPTLYDIAGSANFYNKADLGLIIHRSTEDETIFKVQKSRYHDIIGRPGEVAMAYRKEERRFAEQRRLA